MGKRNTEEHIEEEAQCLVAEIRKTKESFFEPKNFLNKPLCNIIFTLMFGRRHEYEDDELLDVLSWIKETFLIASTFWGQLYEMFPRIMRFVPGRHQKIFSHMEKLLLYVEKRAEMNKKTLDPNNARNYVDAFLIRMEKEKMNPSSEYHLTNLVDSTLQIFFAGVATMSMTLNYSLLILMKYPDTLAHQCVSNADFNAKRPTCFPNPNEFNPQNFLDENGDFRNNDAFMPLAAGKRICLEEGLVRVELFLFLITILQNFNLKSFVFPEDLDITPNISGLGNIPKPYKISFIPR